MAVIANITTGPRFVNATTGAVVVPPGGVLDTEAAGVSDDEAADVIAAGLLAFADDAPPAKPQRRGRAAAE